MKQILIAIDQLGNTLLGGYADETFSARCWRCRKNKPFDILYKIVDIIMLSDTHCKESYAECRRRAKIPVKER